MNGLGNVDRWLVGGEVMHKPSGKFGVVTDVLPPTGVYVDLGDGPELHDSEDFRQ